MSDAELTLKSLRAVMAAMVDIADHLDADSSFERSAFPVGRKVREAFWPDSLEPSLPDQIRDRLEKKA